MSWLSKWMKPNPEPAPDAGAPQPVVGLLSDPGCHRQRNEDSVRAVLAGHGKHGDRGLLVVVADGMGGHEAGEVASNAAVSVIEREYPQAGGTPGEALAAAFGRAHREILRLAKANPAMAGMGTTCTALAITGGKAWAAHVGDSRLYLLRGGGIYQLSEDHTQCMEMVRSGLLTREQAEHHENRNVLVRAMGTKKELAAMTWPEPMEVKPGDAFVLCSDGLHDLVSDPEINQVVSGDEPQEACNRLVRMARERGGYDNITVAVAAVPAAGNGASANVTPTRQHEAQE